MKATENNRQTSVVAPEPASTRGSNPSQQVLSDFHTVRAQTRALAANLSAEDQMVQACPEASPVKWHQAHTTWFFETFVLREFLADYKPFHADFHWLFNSYYTTLGQTIPAKKLRSSFSRPALAEILTYREYVESAIDKLLCVGAEEEAIRRIVLGLNHEQQHQELAYTDIKYAFFTNPLHPTYREGPLRKTTETTALTFQAFEGGLAEIGFALDTKNPLDFCFDNETPRHQVYLEPYQLATRLITCGEYLDFMSDNSYSRTELWLSEAWEKVEAEGWRAPLYWQPDATDTTGYKVFTLRGWVGLSQLLDAPVCHVSLFEADAYARWRGFRLPSEAEWEYATPFAPKVGNLLESGRLHPTVSPPSTGVQQLIGDCWEWTCSSYVGYPGYKPLPGALGEYNGKFMSSQMVLRGGSCVTPASHMRATYRNFFHPATRWQFSGIRLAK